MFFSFFNLTSLKTKGSITIVIEANIQFLFFSHKLFEFFVSCDFAMVSEDIF